MKYMNNIQYDQQSIEIQIERELCAIFIFTKYIMQ
jgi:hypothetical protein